MSHFTTNKGYWEPNLPLTPRGIIEMYNYLACTLDGSQLQAHEVAKYFSSVTTGTKVQHTLATVKEGEFFKHKNEIELRKLLLHAYNRKQNV